MEAGKDGESTNDLQQRIDSVEQKTSEGIEIVSKRLRDAELQLGTLSYAEKLCGITTSVDLSSLHERVQDISTRSERAERIACESQKHVADLVLRFDRLRQITSAEPASE